MLTILLVLLFTCHDTTTSFDVRPFVSTAIDDFLTRKEADRSDVFGVLLMNHKIGDSDILEVCILPEDSKWKFLLSNADSLGTSYVSISYIERNDKLFYWNVNDSCLTQDVYDVLLKYDFIERRDVPNQEWLMGERGYFLDGVRSHQYYFCKCNSEHFKRRYSSVVKLPKRMKCQMFRRSP
ncbi:MAG: hypothetical protein IJA30_07200 [Bacilli bacterium]|nr:hypothetical protein [Bacilli bacterium]